MKKILRIGTRGSQLALWQANWVKSELERVLRVTPESGECCKKTCGSCIDGSAGSYIPEIQIVTIKTTGDQITDRPLAMVGGKGLFVKEIEQQLLDGSIDIAVHSMKDMPAELPEGLCVGAVPVRANPFDVLISRDNMPLDSLPEGAKIGTSSLRRASQLKHAREDVVPVSIRGNLDTRLRKLDSGEYDAIVLAAAGLIRLGMAERISFSLDERLMVPAVGQGALCIESRKNDSWISEILSRIDDPVTRIPVEAERAFLKKMEGSCHIPVACFGRLVSVGDDGAQNRFDRADSSVPAESVKLILTGLVASEDGRTVIRESLDNPALLYSANDSTASKESASRAAEMAGTELAELLLAKGAREILDSLTQK